MSESEHEPESGRRGSGWRERAQFERGEAYSAETGPEAAAAASGALRAAGLGALAAIAALALALLLGAPFWLALILGAAAFLLVGLSLRRGGRTERRVAETTPLGVDRATVQAGLDAAEADLAAIDAIAQGKLSGRGLGAPIREMTAASRRVLDVIAKDPGDYDRARKFLKVYLPSARATVEKYAAFEVIDAELESRFRALLAEMRDTAKRQEDALSLDDRTDLEVEMEVLAERLKS